MSKGQWLMTKKKSPRKGALFLFYNLVQSLVDTCA